MVFNLYLLYFSIFFIFIFIFLSFTFKSIQINFKYYLDGYIIYSLLFLFLFFNYLYANLISDFSIINVQKISNIFQSIFYKLFGSWSNHEGSIFLWYILLLILLYIGLFLKQNYALFLQCFLYFLATSSITFFLFFIIISSNPFLNYVSYILSGYSLNPLLQDFVLAIHPPLLYCGYLSFFILFFKSLILMKLRYFLQQLFNKIYFYLYVNLFFLTIGIFLGSWWAYFELGWGGWWFWDPIENISLFPWLLTIIGLHLIKFLITRNRISIFLYMYLSFILWVILIGVFFVRSGLLVSIHIFAIDSLRGTLLIAFLFIIILITLFYIIGNILDLNQNKIMLLKIKQRFFILYMQILLFFLLFICLFIGTFTPVIVKYFFNISIFISSIFFNEISLLLITISFFYMFFLQITKQTFLKYILFFILIICCLLSCINLSNFSIFFKFYLIVFYLILINLILKTFFFNFQLNMVFHSIFICFVLSIFIYYFGFIEYFILCKPGTFFYFLNYFFIFSNLDILYHYNYYTVFGHFLLFDWFCNKLLGQFFPEKRFYFFEQFSGFKVNILTNYFSDIYLIFSDGQILTGWYLHLMYNPGIPFIWGCIFCFLGLIMYYLFRLCFFTMHKKYLNINLW